MKVSKIKFHIKFHLIFFSLSLAKVVFMQNGSVEPYTLTSISIDTK